MTTTGAATTTTGVITMTGVITTTGVVITTIGATTTRTEVTASDQGAEVVGDREAVAPEGEAGASASSSEITENAVLARAVNSRMKCPTNSSKKKSFEIIFLPLKSESDGSQFFAIEIIL